MEYIQTLPAFSHLMISNQFGPKQFNKIDFQFNIKLSFQVRAL